MSVSLNHSHLTTRLCSTLYQHQLISHRLVEPEQILDRRLVKKGNNAITQVLIKWTNLPEDATTWEDANVLRERFPDALAWGQASSPGEGVVTNEEQKASEGNMPSTIE